MAKHRNSMVQGALEALAFANGERDGYVVTIPNEIDVRAIRARYGLSQAAFANRFGFTLARVRDWEQKRSTPDSAARGYLTLIAREPEAVHRALSREAPSPSSSTPD